MKSRLMTPPLHFCDTYTHLFENRNYPKPGGSLTKPISSSRRFLISRFKPRNCRYSATCEVLGLTYPARANAGEQILFVEVLSHFLHVLAEGRAA